MHEPIYHMTVEREPIQLCEQSTVPYIVGEVVLGVRDGMSFRISPEELYRHPDCWFCIKLIYRGKRADGSQDFDQLITNGEEYWRIRRSLGKSPLHLNSGVRQAIDAAIAQHLGVEQRSE